MKFKKILAALLSIIILESFVLGSAAVVSASPVAAEENSNAVSADISGILSMDKSYETILINARSLSDDVVITHIVLPDESKIIHSSAEYKAFADGIYKFEVYYKHQIEETKQTETETSETETTIETYTSQVEPTTEEPTTTEVPTTGSDGEDIKPTTPSMETNITSAIQTDSSSETPGSGIVIHSNKDDGHYDQEGVVSGEGLLDPENIMDPEDEANPRNELIPEDEVTSENMSDSDSVLNSEGSSDSGSILMFGSKILNFFFPARTIFASETEGHNTYYYEVKSIIQPTESEPTVPETTARHSGGGTGGSPSVPKPTSTPETRAVETIVETSAVETTPVVETQPETQPETKPPTPPINPVQSSQQSMGNSTLLNSGDNTNHTPIDNPIQEQKIISVSIVPVGGMINASALGKALSGDLVNQNLSGNDSLSQNDVQEIMTITDGMTPKIKSQEFDPMAVPSGYLPFGHRCCNVHFLLALLAFLLELWLIRNRNCHQREEQQRESIRRMEEEDK